MSSHADLLVIGEGTVPLEFRSTVECGLHVNVIKRYE